MKRKKIEVQKRELVERKESKKEINSSESKQTNEQKNREKDVVAKLGVECVGGAWDA